MLISALFPKGEPRQPGTRQITFPRFALYPRPILGVEVVELAARSDATFPGKNVKVARIESGVLKGVLPQTRLIRSLVKRLLAVKRIYFLYQFDTA